MTLVSNRSEIYVCISNMKDKIELKEKGNEIKFKDIFENSKTDPIYEKNILQISKVSNSIITIQTYSYFPIEIQTKAENKVYSKDSFTLINDVENTVLYLKNKKTQIKLWFTYDKYFQVNLNDLNQNKNTKNEVNQNNEQNSDNSSNSNNSVSTPENNNLPDDYSIKIKQHFKIQLFDNNLNKKIKSFEKIKKEVINKDNTKVRSLSCVSKNYNLKIEKVSNKKLFNTEQKSNKIIKKFKFMNDTNNNTFNASKIKFSVSKEKSENNNNNNKKEKSSQNDSFSNEKIINKNINPIKKDVENIKNESLNTNEQNYDDNNYIKNKNNIFENNTKDSNNTSNEEHLKKNMILVIVGNLLLNKLKGNENKKEKILISNIEKNNTPNNNKLNENIILSYADSYNKIYQEKNISGIIINKKQNSETLINNSNNSLMDMSKIIIKQENNNKLNEDTNIPNIEVKTQSKDTNQKVNFENDNNTLNNENTVKKENKYSLREVRKKIPYDIITKRRKSKNTENQFSKDEEEFLSKKRKLDLKPENKKKRIEKKCPICLEEVRHKTVLDKCKHEFCYQCITKWCQLSSECPLCKEEITRLFFFNNKYHQKKSKKISNKHFIPDEEAEEDWINNSDKNCLICGKGDKLYELLICDKCNFRVCHASCLNLNAIPNGDWYCPECCSKMMNEEQKK